MSEDQASFQITLIIFLITITGGYVSGDSTDTDKQVLLNLKSFLEQKNPVNKGRYVEWNSSSSPCEWPGIECDNNNRTIKIDLSFSNISDIIFRNFSSLTQLTHLDLSTNTLDGTIPEDLNKCQNLKYLNLSHNIIQGNLNLSGLSSLEVLDLSVNRIWGGIELSFPANCANLAVVNISGNNLTGNIGNSFANCRNLKYLDLSSNLFSGELWVGFDRLWEFSVSENSMSGILNSSFFSVNCSLQYLDLSRNGFEGNLPGAISNCKKLVMLNVWGNFFTGQIPAEIGWNSNLEALSLGNNSFSNAIPESLLNCSKLAFLDLNKNHFGGDIQPIFGKLTQVRFLVLHGNSYVGGIYSSGILNLPNISRLDLSYNNFTGPLPVEISQMLSLKFLVLAYNNFTGQIPEEYGNLTNLQALDLSYNKLNGSIPSSLGKLDSLLWLMLGNNSLSGEIPPELGNCRSLLWLNLAHNQLVGRIPPELTNIGINATPTFMLNRQADRITAGTGECLTMQRWIPADYPPFSFIYNLLTMKSCRSIWDKILKGYGLFPMCIRGTNIPTSQIAGYLQLSGNSLSGEVPPDIGNMQNFSLLHLGHNQFSGNLPPEIGQLPLVVLNLTENTFSSQIPKDIGNIRCLQNLDLSYNNFSGMFPLSLNNLTELSKFNISYNPYISGMIPFTGQLATFEEDSFLGDPLLVLPPFISNSTGPSQRNRPKDNHEKPPKLAAFLVFLVLTLPFVVGGILIFLLCILVKGGPVLDQSPDYFLGSTKCRHDKKSNSGASSPWLSDIIKVIRLDKTAFTHADILNATRNFSEDRVIGKGGSGMVYRGVLPDGRDVAVKKLQREGIEGEREFRAEMEVLSGNGLGWPHPNLVTLYGWCLDGSEKILVYEFMEGGSLEDLIPDRIRLTWRRRVEIAIDVARALVFLHHECYPAIVHRDVKASNVLLDKDGKARVTDFGLARVMDAGNSHVSTIVAGTVGYVAPEYGQTWQATTKGDVYSFGILVLELATGRRAVDGGDECLVEWARRVMGHERQGLGRGIIPVAILGSGLVDGAEEMCELLRIGIKCAAETPHSRPNMKEVLAMLIKITGEVLGPLPH
ncbi:Leucine-rich repeat-containing N-terminal, plant-type [Dillenia turbinata]|uniref:non-specific serine/threonine protein kinase n=1 Tax=Dillenia turbinata TaxID=194707 RepID=A0AAN8Z517_9MAGN